MALLEVHGAERARHGLLEAVREVSFALEKGETLALVGANGAGKTTLLRTIAGAHRAASGRILFNGADVTEQPSHQRAKAGVALVPEGRRLFSRMTVEENLLLARARRACRRLDAGGGVRRVPEPAGPPPQPRRLALGRRAAGDRHRPRADDQPRPPVARRSVARPVAARGGPGLRAIAGIDGERPQRSCWSSKISQARARRSPIRVNLHA